MDWQTHTTYKSKPPASVRNVRMALEQAEKLRSELPERTLPYAEDWDLVILADEIIRLRKMV